MVMQWVYRRCLDCNVRFRDDKTHECAAKEAKETKETIFKPCPHCNGAVGPGNVCENYMQPTKQEERKRILGGKMPIPGANSEGPKFTDVLDDPVNHPSHYTKGEIEVIDFVEDQGFGYHLGNAVKYICRAGYKGDEVEDLKKAVWYINRRIKNLEERKIEQNHNKGLQGRRVR